MAAAASRPRVVIQPRDRMMYNVSGGDTVMRMFINDALRETPQETPKLEEDIQFARSFIASHLNSLPPAAPADALIGLFVAYCMPSEVLMARIRAVRTLFIEHGSVSSIHSTVPRPPGVDSIEAIAPSRSVGKSVDDTDPPARKKGKSGKKRKRKGDSDSSSSSSSSDEDVLDASDPATMRYKAVVDVARHAAILIESSDRDVFMDVSKGTPRMLQSYSPNVVASILNKDAKALVLELGDGGYNIERAFTVRRRYMAMAIAMSYRLTTFYVSGGHTKADRVALAVLRFRYSNTLRELNAP